MLKANVGLSRKLSKDYQSTGFSVNLEGEINAIPSDAAAVVDQIKELYELAEAALDHQIEQSKGTDALASRDESRGAHNGRPVESSSNGSDSQPDEPATEKQVDFLLKIGKRERFTAAKLESTVAEILGFQVGLYDLTKRQAGVVLEALTKGERTVSTRRN